MEPPRPAPGGRRASGSSRRRRPVGREVLAAGLALDDRPRDRPRAAGAGDGDRRGRGRRAGRDSSRSARAAAGAGVAQRGQPGGVGRASASRRALQARRDAARARRGGGARRRPRAAGAGPSAVSTRRSRSASRGRGARRRAARVGALDAAQEAQRLQQLREAVAVQDDGDEVRLLAHVALAQQRGELDAHLGQPLVQARTRCGRPRGAGAPARAAAPRRRQLGLDVGEPALEDGDLARGRPLQRRQPGGRAGERALTRLAGADAPTQRRLACAPVGRRPGGRGRPRAG